MGSGERCGGAWRIFWKRAVDQILRLSLPPPTEYNLERAVQSGWHDGAPDMLMGQLIASAFCLPTV